MTEAEIRADERQKIADFIADFGWNLPMYENKEINIATDEAACSVCEQIAATVRAMLQSP